MAELKKIKKNKRFTLFLSLPRSFTLIHTVTLHKEKMIAKEL